MAGKSEGLEEKLPLSQGDSDEEDGLPLDTGEGLEEKLPLSQGDSDEDDGLPFAKEEHDGIEQLLRKLNIRPTKNLLVIHLDGLVAHSFFPCPRSPAPKHRRPDGLRGRKLIFKRPFCDDFMQYCLNIFDVGIWASATKWYVDGTISVVMEKCQKKLLFVWDQSCCTQIGLKAMENANKPVFLKELKKLWNREDPSLPWPEGRYSPSNTMFIDGSPYRALLNPANTGIFPKPYKAGDLDDKEIGPGSELRAYLEGVAAADDVPSYVKSHPFGQIPVSPDHPDWSYYSQSEVVRDYAHKLH